MCFRRLALGSLTKIFDAPTTLQIKDDKRADRPGARNKNRAAAGHLRAI